MELFASSDDRAIHHLVQSSRLQIASSIISTSRQSSHPSRTASCKYYELHHLKISKSTTQIAQTPASQDLRLYRPKVARAPSSHELYHLHKCINSRILLSDELYHLTNSITSRTLSPHELYHLHKCNHKLGRPFTICVRVYTCHKLHLQSSSRILTTQHHNRDACPAE